MSAAITFAGLRSLFGRLGVMPRRRPLGFRPARTPGWGRLFPLSGGLLQSAGIQEDLLGEDVVSSYGRSAFIEAIREFESGRFQARLLEVLCCNGCVMGSGIASRRSLFERRALVSHYVRARMTRHDPTLWQTAMERFAALDLVRAFQADSQIAHDPLPDELEGILHRLGKLSPADELNCGACGYDTCREHAVAIHKGLAESEMCLPYTIDQLRKSLHEQAIANRQLASMQEALMQSEKLASMGQLAAGIAHEVNNPLGVVLIYAHLMQEELAGDPRYAEDLAMIVEQADRCKKIVAGLLHFARQNRLALRPTPVNRLVLRGVQAMRLDPRVTVRYDLDPGDTTAEIDRDQIVQVLTNLVSNAVAAMPDGGTLTVRTLADADSVSILVSDTGVGIPKENLPKIFEPFFTTKQIGKGDGARAGGDLRHHQDASRRDSRGIQRQPQRRPDRIDLYGAAQKEGGRGMREELKAKC